MPGQSTNFTSTSSSYSSFSFSASSSFSTSTSSSSSNSNGQTIGTTRSGTRYATHSQTNPSGTTVQTASQNLGQPIYHETRHFDNRGREMVGAPQTVAAANANNQRRRIQDIEVEDVTDEYEEADKKYREGIEDEYAKREGGA